MAQTVKNPSAMRETWVRPLGWEDLLQEGMAIRCSVLAWRVPWTEQPGGPQSMGSQRVRHAGENKHSFLGRQFWETPEGKRKMKQKRDSN